MINHPTAAPPHVDETHTGSPAQVVVTVYSAGPGCRQCAFTCRRLAERHVPFVLVDLSDESTPAALREYVTEELGYFQAPVVVVGDHPQHHWSGFRPDLIDALAGWAGSPIIPHALSGRTLS
ncbi:glutaredoxin family protein [Microbacterium sp. NPDC055910]|uniref:glutaredoxin family protein n=1 Tax=Microbacterium sp. NPDC055910 TaxID=3345659 RepID=UPI0035E393E4